MPLKCLWVRKGDKFNLMLELKNISFNASSGDSKREILKNISLKIDERFVAFTGPNGGGKSTLAKVIAGIVTPTEGEISLTVKILPHCRLRSAQRGASVLLFSSRCVLRELPLRISLHLHQVKKLE